VNFDLSKKNNSKLVSYTFLLLILTIGFPFSAFTDLPEALGQVGEDPIIVLNGINPQHVKLGDGYSELGAIAFDTKDGDISGSIVIDTSNFVDAVGNYTIYYDVTDSDTNTYQETRTVNVKDADNNLPVINLIGFDPQNIVLGDGYIELGATASDSEDGDLTGSIVIDTTNFVDALGFYYIFYSVTDSDSNFVEAVRVVNVNPIYIPPPIPDPEPQPDPEPLPPIQNTTTRFESSQTIMLSDTRGITTMGLPDHVLDNQGDWVANIFNEDSTGVQLESGTVSYYYGKLTCGMTQFEKGRISETSTFVIQSNSWGVKVAPNGTDNWVDVSQNTLPCVVSTSIDGDTITLNSTRSDSEGTISEIWEYEKYGGLKQTIFFTNDDSSYSDHKFHFSNILENTPKSFILSSVNSTDNSTQSNSYSLYPSGFQPPQMSDSTILIGDETIQFDYEDMFFNGTAITDSFTWLDKDLGLINYDFDLGIDRLWSLKFIANTDNTLDVYVDYANVDQTLAVGSTMELDPTTLPPETDYMRVLSTAFVFTSGACGQGWASATIDGGFTTFRTGGKETCANPVFKYDISAIPDTATPLSMTYEILVVDNSDSAANSGFLNGGGHVRPVILEDIFFASTRDIGDVVFNRGDGGVGNIMQGSNRGFNVGAWFVTADHSLHGGIGNTGIMTNTQLILSGTTNTFETQLESGRNFYILVWCNNNGNTGGSCSAGTNTASGTNFMTFDPNGTFLTVEWEQFQPSDAPQAPITAVYSPSPDSCFVDWNPPLFTGGRPITGYQISRSTGGAFQIIEADTGGSLPTSFTDTTIIGGTSNVYQISAITLEGIGVSSISSNGCGVPVPSGEPFLQTLTNIGVGLVALDWLAPSFDGNDPITGYKIERTVGTPTTTNGWTFIDHQREGSQSLQVPCGGTVINVGDSVGHWRVVNDFTTTVEGFCLSTDNDHSGIGHAYIWKAFTPDALKDRPITIVWDQFKKAAGFSLQSFGNWETRIMIIDGVYDMTDANVVGGTGTFVSGVSGIGAGDNVGLHLPSGAGNGIILDCLDTVNNTVIVNGANPVVASLPNTSQMQGGGSHEIRCNAGSLSNASQSEVMLVFQLYDNQSSLDGCGSNCASSGSGAVVIDFIDIDGLGTWDFSNNLPLETVIDIQSPSDTLSIFGVMAVLNFLIGDGFASLIDDTGNTQTEFIDNTVVESTNYGYRVSAINGQGIGDPSNVVAILTAGAPSPPIITVTATGTTSINIAWTEPDLNEGILVEYELERKLGTSGFFTSLDTTTNEFFDDGTGLFSLQSNVEYCYHVKTITNIGDSTFSIEQCATTFDAPSGVLNLEVTAIDGSSVNMSFDDPVSDGGSAITGFQIEQKIGAQAFQIVQSSNSFNKIRNDTGLPIGTLISYKVIAFNQFGGGQSATASDTTDATPQVPQNFSCSASSSTSLTLNWDTPATFSLPTGYQIDRRTIGGGFSTLVANTADTATQFLDQSLPVDSTFEYRILGITTEGNTDFTPIIRCVTLGQPDFPPEDLQGDFTSTLPHQMVLAWDIPDTFGIPITSFRIERDDGAGYNVIGSVSGSSFLFIDVDPQNAVSQRYRVFTVGSVGVSPPSIAIPFIANQTSHWAYEKSIDDTGGNKNSGLITGTANFDNLGINGLGHLFDGSTYITVSDSDYDQDNNVSTGITTYYRGNSTGVLQALVTKANTFTSIGYSMFIDSTGVLGVRILNTATSNELHVLGSTNVTDNSLHFLGFGYDGNNDESGLSLMVDGIFETKNVITNTLSSTILNNNDLTIGAYDSGSNTLTGLLDDTRFFGSGTLDDATLEAVANNSIDTVIPIVATITIGGATFADISSEQPLILMTSGYPLPTIDTITLFNFTSTNVNSNTPALIIDGVSGQFILDPQFFNIMSSLSNYTAVGSLTNSEETFPLLSNFDIQVPLFTFSGDFFFQQQRNEDFSILSFNFTQTIIPFDLDCNFKSTLFGNGTTVEFDDVFFVQLLQPVAQLEDVVVACIDPTAIILDPSAPSFGGGNTLLSFVSFGDTTGVGNFLQFTNNYGDFFGVGLPFLFVIILAAAFTGRSAPTGILIIGVAIGIMSAIGILEVDPFMWGIYDYYNPTRLQNY